MGKIHRNRTLAHVICVYGKNHLKPLTTRSPKSVYLHTWSMRRSAHRGFVIKLRLNQVHAHQYLIIYLFRTLWHHRQDHPRAYRSPTQHYKHYQLSTKLNAGSHWFNSKIWPKPCTQLNLGNYSQESKPTMDSCFALVSAHQHGNSLYVDRAAKADSKTHVVAVVESVKQILSVRYQL